MNNKQKNKLWINFESNRFFLVPENEKIISGSYIVKTITGLQSEVELGSVKQFEISREEAKQWLKSEFSSFIEDATKAFQETMEKDRDGPPAWSVAGKQKANEKRTREFDSSSSKAESRGQTSSENDAKRKIYATTWKTFTTLLTDLGGVLENKYEKENIFCKSSELRNILNGKSYYIADNGESILNKVEGWLNENIDNQYTQDSADHLEQIANGIDKAALRSSENIRKMADSIRKRSNSKDKNKVKQ